MQTRFSAGIKTLDTQPPWRTVPGKRAKHWEKTQIALCALWLNWFVFELRFQRIPAGVFGGISQFGFDAEQLVIFRNPV